MNEDKKDKRSGVQKDKAYYIQAAGGKLSDQDCGHTNEDIDKVLKESLAALKDIAACTDEEQQCKDAAKRQFRREAIRLKYIDTTDDYHESREFQIEILEVTIELWGSIPNGTSSGARDPGIPPCGSTGPSTLFRGYQERGNDSANTQTSDSFPDTSQH